jgi:hypothetical protein
VPEPEPERVKVDPLGEKPPMVLPDGFVVAGTVGRAGGVFPVELPLPLIVVPLEPAVPAARYHACFGH